MPSSAEPIPGEELEDDVMSLVSSTNFEGFMEEVSEVARESVGKEVGEAGGAAGGAGVAQSASPSLETPSHLHQACCLL